MPDYVQIKKIRIGDLLVEQGLISAEQLQEVLTKQKDVGGKIGQLLIRLGYVDETRLLQILSDQLKMPFIDLSNWKLKPEISKKLPERIARRFRVLLLDQIDKNYLLGMSDPTDILAYDEVNHLLDKPLSLAVVREGELLQAIDQVYRRSGEIESLAEELIEELTVPGRDEVQAIAEAAPVAKMLDSIFQSAVQVGASDIHIEPDEDCVRIRNRVDGILHENIIQGKNIMSALVLRIKLMAELDISEKRLPQDGRFFITVNNRDIDIRLSTMPVRNGESVVMRLLDQSRGVKKLEDLGMPEFLVKRLKFLISRPNGMFLVTGPTGSGKTTTLYAALSELNNVESKVVTIEDPVEYRLPLAIQVQINETIDLSFSSVLRATLRQDPDIIMVGEMRDEETARIGIRAAMTGHIVFSTLHTNNAISTAMRLIDMGIEGYLVASALHAILAQRLVRSICKFCKHDYSPNDQEIEWMKLLLNKNSQEYKFFAGAGCQRCSKTGYHGRIGIYELLEMDHTLAELLRNNDTSGFEMAARNKPGFKPLSEYAFQLAVEGQTTLSEALKISSEVVDAKQRTIVEEE